jgi:hypothetical protein
MEDILAENVVRILFTKKNGDLREMVCTRDPEYTPPVSGGDGPQARGLMIVYDLEKEGWRSVYEESIIEFRTLDDWPLSGDE